MLPYPAPLFVQRDDEDLVLEIGLVVYPEKISRNPDENGLRLWVDGTEPESKLAAARSMFQVALGILRAWRPSSGELEAERLQGLGRGTVRNERGDQWVLVGPAVTYETGLEEVRKLLVPARKGIEDSNLLAQALWSFGRTNVTSVDFYVIYEYAEDAFNGKKGIAAELGLSADWQGRLTNAANNLPAALGGRHHPKTPRADILSPVVQREYVGLLLRRWIGRYLEDAAA